jgi:hypothetical protein
MRIRGDRWDYPLQPNKLDSLGERHNDLLLTVVRHNVNESNNCINSPKLKTKSFNFLYHVLNLGKLRMYSQTKLHVQCSFTANQNPYRNRPVRHRACSSVTPGKTFSLASSRLPNLVLAFRPLIRPHKKNHPRSHRNLDRSRSPRKPRSTSVRLTQSVREQAPKPQPTNASDWRMEQLQRTQSRESAQSLSKSGGGGGGGGAHSLSSASSATSTSRKARSAENETTSGHVERTGVSMPPPASRTVSRNFPPRRLSKASDSLLLLSPGIDQSVGESPLLGHGGEDLGAVPASGVEGNHI